MTLHDVRRLTGHWKRTPPLRVIVMSVAASLGVKFPDHQPSPETKYMTADDARRMIHITGGKIEGVHG